MARPDAEYLDWQTAAMLTSLSISTLRRLAAQGRLQVFRPTERRSLLSRRQLTDMIEGDVHRRTLTGEEPLP
jgi:hypothetical protein